MKLSEGEKQDLVNSLVDSPLFSQSGKHSDLQPAESRPQPAIRTVNTGGYNGLVEHLRSDKPEDLTRLEKAERKVLEREQGWQKWRTTDPVTCLMFD